MMRSKRIIDKELDIKLINLVKANPLLYNPKDPHYQDLDARELAWQKIGDIMFRAPNLCKSRWANMRDHLRKQYRKQTRDKKHSAHYYKFESEMSFLIPYFMDKESASTETEDYETEYLEPEQNDMSQADPFEMPENYVQNDLKPIFNGQFVTRDSNFSTTDSIDVFLLSIGSTLRKLSPYYLNQAKSKIFQIVQDYELKQIIDRDQSVPGTSGECSNA